MRLNIKPKLEEKGISRYELAKLVGITYPTVDSIYKGKSTSIKLEILENICKVLECTPNEILVFDDPRVNRILAYYNEINKIYNKKSDTE